LWEAFLLQMNEFDRFLEIKLRQMLDPVAMSQPPARRGRLKRPQKPILAIVPAVGPAAVELAAEAIPVTAAPQL
jgi:hypothetical protein